MQNSFFSLCLLVLALIGGALACSSGGSSPEGTGGAGDAGGVGGSGAAVGGSGGTNACSTQGVAETDLPDALIQAICPNIGPCCAKNGFAYDGPACAANGKAYIGEVFFEGSRVPGATYDPVQACICMEAIRQQTTTCTPSSHGLVSDTDSGSPCYGVYKPPVGTTPLGGYCEYSYECAPDSEHSVGCSQCSVDGGFNAMQLVCELYVVVAEGEHCDWVSGACSSIPKASCDSATFCDYGSLTCKRKLKLGETCNPTQYNCDEGLYCPNNICIQRLNPPVNERMCRGDSEWG